MQEFAVEPHQAASISTEGIAPAPSCKPDRWEPLVSAAVVLACLVPFLGKPFHIDDPLFVWAAKQIQDHPGKAYDFPVNWYGFEMPMWEVTKNPPLACYYLAAAGAVLGFSEPALHAAFLIPAAAAGLGSYVLTRQFCSRPLLAALAGILTPVFLVSATTVMCDGMMLALWVWSLYFWITGLQSRKRLRLFLAAVLVSLCALTKYYGMAMIPLLAVYTILRTRRMGIDLLFLLIPLLLLGGYQGATHTLYGKGLLGDAAAYATNRQWTLNAELLLRLLASLAFMGGCIGCVLFFAPPRWLLPAVAIMAVAVILLPMHVFPKVTPHLLWKPQLIFMTAGGLLMLLFPIADLWRKRDAESILLLLWVYGTFLFTAIVNWDVNARSILPMTPAAGILIARRLDASPKHANCGFWRIGWPLVPAAALALAVCWADYTLARSARDAAKTISRTYRSQFDRLYFQGHWGFQYYLQEEGAVPLNFEKAYRPGDLIVFPDNNTNVIDFPKERIQTEEKLTLERCPWLVTVNRSAGAGFYSSLWGPMPYVFANTPPEHYTISRIIPPPPTK